MIQKHRIPANVGEDKKITLELKQEYDLLEILSLKFTQQQTYTSICGDYGVVCGRISVNNGLGVPNARVSIFIPLTDLDEDDPVISSLYPYKEVTETNEGGYRYNLLPSRKQHGGHEPTGSFFDQNDILSDESYLEVYEKYYNFTVKTNDSGDFMIWGVPLGTQTLHVDVDLSDMGCFSLRPNDFIRQGIGVDRFKSQYEFKSSSDLNTLPQIITFDKTIEVYPFWGNEDLCEIGITRTDFDLSDVGVKVEPKSYFLGSIYTDQGNNSVNKNCTPRNNMGSKCGLTTGAAKVEIIRFTNRKDENGKPILEYYDIQEDIDDDGSFVIPLPMNIEYVYTNEFGEIEVTNDTNKGVPTSGIYRFRISMMNSNLGRRRYTGSYLIPNIREYTNDIDKSYAWSLNFDDYPTSAIDEILSVGVDGTITPQDFFYKMSYNKVYTLTSFMGGHYDSGGLRRETYLGLKGISPKEEDDCENNVVTPPINFAMMKINFSILLAIIINTFEYILYTAFIAIIQVLIVPFQWLYSWKIPVIKVRPFKWVDKAVIEPLQRFGTLSLGLTLYPECETCDGEIEHGTVDYSNLNLDDLYGVVGSGVAIKDINTSLSYGDPDPNVRQIILSDANAIPLTSYTPITFTFQQMIDIITNIDGEGYGRFLIRNNTHVDKPYTTLSLEKYNGTYFLHNDSDTYNDWAEWDLPSSSQITYTIFDTNVLIPGSITGSTIPTPSLSGCASYNTMYDESIVGGMYCDGSEVPVTTCTTGTTITGQVISSGLGGNKCTTCGTNSGHSEIRGGLFIIIPSANTSNWSNNFGALSEYRKRKLVGKVFCEGIASYSFTDNWLGGSLYLFPFKAKVRWNDEGDLDLDYRRTKYCKNLMYYKVPHKLFYYRSTIYNAGTGNFSMINPGTTSLGHPTTIIDLGPRDEFIRDICVDPSLDPNCSISRSIGSSSYQDFKEMLGLYINYRMDTNTSYTYKDFFDNNGYNSILPPKMDGRVLNGDILQLISMNCEVGIDEFDLEDRNYSIYSPTILDPDDNEDLFKVDSGASWGPLPINLVLDDIDGARVRSCLNEPGRLTESSQIVPFFLWNKGGDGFGRGVNQSWNYGNNNIQKQKIQGMEYNYAYNGENSHKYMLLPMTKSFTGTTKVINTVNNDVRANVESLSGTTLVNYDNQEEGFTFLHITVGDLDNPISGTMYTRVGEITNWVSTPWDNTMDFIIKPTSTNYTGNLQILSTPFLFYFGLRPGKTAIDKFVKLFGDKDSFNSSGT